MKTGILIFHIVSPQYVRLVLTLAIILNTFFVLPAQDNVYFENQNFTRYFRYQRPTCLLQDSRGFIWVGSRNGVSRFNGHEFLDFKDNLVDNKGFRGRNVTAISEDSKGRIWVITDGNYINCFDHDSGSFRQAPVEIPGLEEIKYRSIVEYEGRLIISAEKGFKEVIEKEGEFEILVLPLKIKTEVLVNGFLRDSENQLYAYGDKLYSLDFSGDSISVSIILNKTIRDLQHDRNDGLLALTDYEILHIQASDDRIESLYSFEENISLNSFLYDLNGEIWVGTNLGLMQFKTAGNFSLIENKTYDIWSVNDVIQTYSGDYFISSERKGLLKLNWNYDQYRYIALPPKYDKLYVYQFLEDSKGYVWVGTNGGLFKMDPKSFEIRKFDISDEEIENPAKNSINHIIEDSLGNIWIASHNGVYIFDYEKNTFYKPASIREIEKKYSSFLYNLVEMPNGEIFFMSHNKIFSIDRNGQNLKVWGNLDGSRKYFIDSKKRIWVFDSNNTMRQIEFKGDEVNILGTYLENKIPGPTIRYLTEDELGHFWLSWEFGIIVFNPERNEIVENFTSENLLFEDDVFEMINDSNGNIWVKQARFGSILIDPESMDIIRYSPKWLIREDVKDYSCVNYAGKNGMLYTDGNGGFFMFHTDSIYTNTVSPRIELQRISVNKKQVEKTELSSLNYFENNLEFDFTGLHYDAPDRINYSVFLEGYDEHWNNIKTQRTVRYSSLGSGAYKLMVKAANPDGLWSEPKLLAQFEIKPPLWKSNSAYLFYFVAILLILWVIYRFQLNRKLELAESRRLKEIDAFKNRFFTNITHEFRTPLTIIMGVAEKMNNAGSHLIGRNARQLLNLVNQIIELTRLENNSVRLNIRIGNIIKYLNYIFESYHTLASDKNIEFIFSSDDKEVLMDYDPDRLQMIMQNLISNAIKFTPENGRILMTVQRNISELKIRVSDTGPGIPAADREKIFDRFYQMEGESSKVGGSGIGLALSKELVKMMNGKIQVESESGKGSNFIVTLPISANSTEADRIPEKKAYEVLTEIQKNVNSEKLEVLLVEDSPDIRNFIVESISDEFEVNIAKNGREGIEKALELVPDIIISDVMMPEKDGLELSEILKSDIRTSHIPIILLTAKSDLDSRLKGLITGADIYLPKPFNLEELKIHLNNLAEQRKRIQQYFSSQISMSDISLPEKENAYVKKIDALLEKNIDNSQYSVDSLSQDLNLSRMQVYRKLKALTGKSVVDYINSFKLKRSLELIEDGEFNISEIAYRSGFSDPNYFSRVFKKEFERSPSEYIRDLKKV